jgi:N-acetylglucosamine-6-sulfatase
MLRAALLASVFLLSSPVMAAPPNIIVIMTDDQTDDLASMPQVSARLAKGTRFTNSFVDFSLCSPSRATFMSGQRALNHGVGEKGDENDHQATFVRKGTLPMWLREVGYTTALIGVKAMSGQGEGPAKLGFDHFAVIEDHETNRYFDPTLNVNGVLEPHIGEYSTDVFRDEAIDFIRATPKPYFLYIATAAPHAPALPAPRHAGLCGTVALPRPPSFNEANLRDKPTFIAALPRYDAIREAKVEKGFRKRCETLLSVDEMAAELIDRAGKYNCVFLTSDNGFVQGQHRYTGKLLAAYEESIRVPLVMWGCGAPPGAQIDALVGSVDLPATILDLAGAASGRRADGRSLLPLLAGAPWRTALPISGAWGWQKGSTGETGTSQCVRTVRWTYCAHSNGERELYDLAEDPYQLRNRAATAARASVVAALDALSTKFRDCAGARCWFDGDPLAAPVPQLPPGAD